MKTLVIANWKMNPVDLVSAKKLFNSLKKEALLFGGVDIVVCPPSIFLSEIKKLYSGKRILFGIQNIYHENTGAFTGEISSTMAKAAGASFSIIGHSERRQLGDTDKDVSAKIKSALQNGLTPVVCIGEKERNEDGGHFAFLSSQLKESLSSVTKKDLSKIVIAYEPIWAIGENSKGAMDPREIHETSLYIRRILSDMYGKKEAMEARLIYGGSVDDRNAKIILEEGAVSGFLVGRASLDPIKFSKIVKACS